ncbi:MAG: tryptophan synthase subunit alpha [Deferribacteraceae bacterium]|jgi:tryptophan synthase alpha chain|nr:tryptophan synthase subunit alpha [Deferribacteraceae bacterium]
MSRIANAFKDKAFVAFLTGGDPDIAATEEFVMQIVKAGADVIEIGIPFSDPIAEGPVIQSASVRALAAGTTLEGLFQLVSRLRQKTEIPLLFMGYLNPIFNYGYEAFFKRCATVGVDGIIIADLPFEESAEVRQYASVSGVDLISMVAPTSDSARIKQIATDATGFVYVVSSKGVTGVRSGFSDNLNELLAEVKASTNVPAAVGFGIHTPEQAAAMAKQADGVIVGSAIVKIIEKYGREAGEKLYEYVKEMKQAL